MMTSLSYQLYYTSTCVQSVMSSLQEEKIDDSLEFLILASDGLWDVFSNEVCQFDLLCLI